VTSFQTIKLALLFPLTICCFFMFRVVFRKHPGMGKIIYIKGIVPLSGFSSLLLFFTLGYLIHAGVEPWWKLVAVLASATAATFYEGLKVDN